MPTAHTSLPNLEGKISEILCGVLKILSTNSVNLSTVLRILPSTRIELESTKFVMNNMHPAFAEVSSSLYGESTL